MSQQTTVDDIEVHVIRKDGKFTCKFVNMILPQDIHQIQKCIGNNYEVYRRMLVASAHKAFSRKKDKEEAFERETKIIEDKKEQQKPVAGNVQRTNTVTIVKGKNNGS